VIGNVERAVREHGIHYPVAVDNNYGTWDAWANQYWPADYLIDRSGDVREVHFGEGSYGQTQDDIRLLLGERGSGPMAHARDAITPATSVATPETYLGTYRAGAYTQHLHPGGLHDYAATGPVAANAVVLAGSWDVESHQIVAGPGAHLLFRYTAPRIYLVAAPPTSGPATLGVSVDGAAQPPVQIPADDLYQLAHTSSAGPHLLDLAVPAGTTLYSFTFG
jgi:hypothetical protein